jgi:predicted Zn finger-like uncharacterized protein
MNVGCPHCQTRYELPETLLGPGGARVRCPKCAQSFLVGPDGGISALMTAAPPLTADETVAAPAVPAAGGAEDAAPADVARRVLERLALTHGTGIEAAIANGRLFSEYGQRLIEAYDEYRRAVGRRTDAAPFRDALRERWGIDLTPHWGE